MTSNKFAIVKHGYISLPDYTPGDCLKLENILSEYDDVTHKREYYGLSYNKYNKELRVPVGVGINSVTRWTGRTATIDYDADEARRTNIDLLVGPRDGLQEYIINYIIEKNKKYSQSGIIAGTGVGKTYCAIACSVLMGNVVMVVSHSSKLRSHWKKKILEYTDITDDDIFIMDSSQKIMKILEKGTQEKYKIFSTTHQILNSLGGKKGWDYIGKVFRELGIGTTIIDEAHRRFKNTVRILTHTNSKKYLLLTATFKQTGSRKNNIFQSCFAAIPKFVQSQVTKEKTQKHINGFMIPYSSYPSMEVQLSCESVKGLNTVWYDNYLVDEDYEFYAVFDTYFLKCINGCKSFNGKGLIMCGSIHACEKITGHILALLKEEKEDMLVGMYHSKTGMNQKDKDNMLENSDIIITTSGSLGEGTDIDGLHYIIDIEAYRSEVLCEQLPGRLRDLDDGHKFNYIKIVNTGFKKAASQLRDCIDIYRKNMNSVKILPWK